MKFFYSPKTLIDLCKNRQKIAEAMSEHQPGWYLSKAGEQAYRNVKTFAQKTNYFYEYLCAISQTSVRPEWLYKVAFVMAAIDGCSLPYATYPECLSQENNPLVQYVSENYVREKADGIRLLKRVSPSGLSFVGEDGEISDTYQLERYIMAAFDLDYQFNEMSEDTAVKVVGDDDDLDDDDGLDDDGDDLDEDDDWDDDEEEEE